MLWSQIITLKGTYKKAVIGGTSFFAAIPMICFRVLKNKFAYTSISKNDWIVSTRTFDPVFIAPLFEYAVFILILQFFSSLFVDLQMQRCVWVIDEI